MRAESQYFIESVAGTNEVGDGAAATDAQLGGLEGVAIDAAGNVYLADAADHRVRRINAPGGTIVTIAGDGHPGTGGDGGHASEARLNRPYGVASDRQGNVFIADFGNGRVRRIAPDGSIDTVAGGAAADAPDTPALQSRLLGPRNVAPDEAGGFYVSDFIDHRVYRVTALGQIAVVAGTGAAGFNGDGPASSARLDAPAGLALGPGNILYIADSGNNRIRQVAGGVLSTVLQGEVEGYDLVRPTAVAVDAAGNLYVADSGNARVLVLTFDGRLLTLVPPDVLDSVRDVTVDANGNVYVAGDRQLWRVALAKTPELVAGSGEYGDYGEDAPALHTWLDGPVDVAVDLSGDIYIVEEGRYRVRKIDADGMIRTVAGNGTQGYDGDGAQATLASFVDPVAVAAGPAGSFWATDYLGHRIRRVDAGGTINTVAGSGEGGYDGAVNPGDLSVINYPRGLSADALGNLYFADSMNHCVRRIGRDGYVVTIAGNGVRGYSGDLGPAVSAQLNTPSDVAVSLDGSLYIADAGNHVIRRISADGFISTFAGDGLRAFGGDGGPAVEAHLDYPSSVAVGNNYELLIADTNNHRIRRVNDEGIIKTVAGSGTAGFAGDGGFAAAAHLRYPTGVAVGPDGVIYFADAGNQRVRKLYSVPTSPIEEPIGECSILNAASFRNGPIAPGQLVSVFTPVTGLKEAAMGKINTAGTVGSLLAGIEVRFNGYPSPLFYADSSQINAQVPYGLQSGSTISVEVYLNGELHSRGSVSIVDAAPGLFTLSGGSGQAVAVNENGSLNSPSNPALRGSVVVLYATGEGRTHPDGLEGRPARAPFATPILPVSVRVGGSPVTILYAGAAPGFAGLMQINIQLPDGFFPTGNLPVELSVGGTTSQPGTTISVQ